MPRVGFVYRDLDGTSNKRASGCCGGCAAILMDSSRAAVAAAFYTICMSLLMCIISIWRLVHNSLERHHVDKYYWGLQTSQGSEFIIHAILITSSTLLLYGISKHRQRYVLLWIICSITMLVFDSVATAYSCLLRQQIIQHTDRLTAAEIIVFVVKTVLNIVCVLSVLWFNQDLKEGRVKYWHEDFDDMEIML